MSTPRARTLVSLAALMIASVALSACAGSPSRLASDEPAPLVAPSQGIRFTNDALYPVDVFLIANQREWRLGRVSPGGDRMLRIPAASLTRSLDFLQLAVVPSEGRDALPGRAGRATRSLAQLGSELLAQRWTFSESQVGSLRLSGTLATAAPRR